MQGHGIYTWKDASQYQGQFVSDKSKGEGVYSYPHGSTFRTQDTTSIIGRHSLSERQLIVLSGREQKLEKEIIIERKQNESLMTFLTKC